MNIEKSIVMLMACVTGNREVSQSSEIDKTLRLERWLSG